MEPPRSFRPTEVNDNLTIIIYILTIIFIEFSRVPRKHGFYERRP